MTTARWVLLALVTLLLVGLWVLAVLVPDLRWFTEALTVVIAVCAGLPLLVPWLRARWERAAAHPSPSGQDRERAALSARIRAVVRQLEAARAGRGARSRPCYLALGTAGSGQPRLLDGLGFTPLSTAPLDARSRANAAELAVIEAWGSRDALVLAVECRADDAGDAWRVLLEELKGVRGQRSLEGALLSVPIADIAANGKSIAADLRSMWCDVVDRVGVVVPVYVVFTGIDAVTGFVEFWDKSERAAKESWGASFALRDGALSLAPERAFEPECEVLAAALHPRLIARVARLSDPAARLRALRFPSEFRALAPAVVAFLTELVRADGVAERFCLRGFYFTSPAHFSAGLLSSVVLPDRGVALPSGRALRRRALQERRLVLASIAVSALFLAPTFVSFVHELDVATRVVQVAAALRGDARARTPGTKEDPIEGALDALDLCAHDAPGFSVPGWFGPRAARALVEPLGRAYTARLHAWLGDRLATELGRRLAGVASASSLADAPSRPDDETPMRSAYETIRLDAFLVDPRAAAARGSIARELARTWRSLLPEAAAVAEDRLADHAGRYIAALALDPNLAWPAPRALATARDRLRRLDARGMPLRRVVLTAAAERPVRASAMFSSAALAFLESRGDVQVPGAFTLGGWDKVRQVVHSPEPWRESLVVERWALGDEAVPEDDAARRGQVMRQYLDEYERHWMSFLDELKVRVPGDAVAARAELAAFKQGDGFFRTLFGAMKDNAIHEEAPAPSEGAGLLGRVPWLGGVAQDAGAKSPGAALAAKSFGPILAFAGAEGMAPTAVSSPLDKYLAILDAVGAALDAAAVERPQAPDASDPFAAANAGLRALLDGIEEPAHARLWRLLSPPILGSMRSAKSATMNTLSTDWKADVWTAWDEKLRNRYPFSRAPNAESASFADFAAFFRPDGALWKFAHARLGDRVEERGDGHYATVPGADPVGSEMLDCLTMAQAVTDAFFADGGEPGLRVSVEADWTDAAIPSAKLWVGPKDTALARSQWTGPILWFGEDVGVEWVRDGRPTREIGRHSFSFYDLFDHLGGLRSVAGRAVYVAECPPLTLHVRPEGKVDALKPDFFARLKCPREIRSEAP
jgi:type VI protein secretion system component VasK